jgi:hypothetical protein
VNIAEGWEAAQEALRVREWRTRKNLANKFTATPPRPVTLLEQQAVWLRGRVQRIVAALGGAPLPTPWPLVPTFKKGGPTTLEQCDLLNKWCVRVDAELGLPFPESTPPHLAAFADATEGMAKPQVAALAAKAEVAGVAVSALGVTDVARILEHTNSNTKNTNQEKETTSK